MDKLLTQLKKLLSQLLDLLKKQQTQTTVVINPITETPQVIPTPQIESIKQSIIWGDFPESEKLKLIPQVKEICKKNGLTDQMTIDVCRTIWAESGWNPYAQNVPTEDFGLCQLNLKWYLKPNNMTGEEALNNPMKCVEIMSKAFKNGRADDWIAHRSKNYLKAPLRYYS